ncbi:MAG: PEP-CTERM sorting domain-containing protein [Terriglobia bacterium]
MRIPNRVFQCVFLVGLVAFLALVPTARGDTAYITGGNNIYAWNTTTNTISLVTTAPAALDSLIFDTHGNIIYSIIATDQLGVYNPNTNSNSILATVGAGAADMTLEPGGNSVLVSDAFSTTIDRVNLTTKAVTSLNVHARPDGLAYDSNGDLFAVLGLTEVAQLNPATGAILKTISTPNQPDGLTFDAMTGKLYVGSDGGGFYTLPTDLSSATFTRVNGDVIDGVASNGNTLYLIQRGADGLQYDLTSNTLTATSPAISSADDIAPLAGLGSPTTTPEPSSLILLGTGLLVLMGSVRRKFSTYFK